MDIVLCKNTTVSLHEQLVTQISMQIAAGVLPPGQKLPSIRALAQKLKIHANTCLSAYRELEHLGLVEMRQGSGVKVLHLNPELPIAPQNTDLAQAAELFVKYNLQKGFRWEEITEAIHHVQQKLKCSRGRPLVFVDEHPDILPLFKAEIEQQLALPVAVEALSSFQAAKYADYHFIVSRYHYPKLDAHLKQAHIPTEDRITIVNVGSAQAEMQLIRELPEGSLVTILSISTIILQQAEAVITALRGYDLLVRSALFQDEGMSGAVNLIKRSKIVFVDFPCYQKIRPTSKKVHLIRVLPDKEIEKIKPIS